MPDSRYPFADPVTRRPAALVVNEAGVVGVEHDFSARDATGRCGVLADVTVELDAWFCPLCGSQGRVSGAWVAKLLAGTHADRFGPNRGVLEQTDPAEDAGAFVPVAAFRELFDFAAGADEQLHQEMGVGPYTEPDELARARAILDAVTRG